MNRIADRLLCLLFPRRCAFCGRAIPYDRETCEDCLAKLPVIEPPLCPCCGRAKRDCTCAGRQTAVDRSVAPYYYEGPARRGILGLKDHGQRYAAKTYGRAMADAVRREYADVAFDLVVPVPLLRAKERERGYNQCALLARTVAAELDFPFREALCQIEETAPQKELPAVFRSGNVLGVYDLCKDIPVAGKRVLLVDDIATTGATMHECAKMLKIYGAAAVYGVSAVSSRLSKGQG